MDASLCDENSVLQEPCCSGSKDQEELQHEALSCEATVENSESHDRLLKPVKPNINGLMARKKGLKCFDVENYAFKDVKILKERNIFSVKLDSRNTCLWKCCKCLPNSSNKLMNEDLLNAGLVNILSLPLLNNKYPWTRLVCDLRFVCSKECGGKYSSFTRDVLTHSRISKAIQDQMEADGIVEKGCPIPDIWLRPYEEKVQRTLSRMSAAVSRTLIRATGWFLFKLFKSLLSSIVVHKGQMHVIQRTCKMETPVLFLPVHRSHLDYILLSFVLFNFNTRLPYVAAGDNLILPIFGMLMRGLGGFFIRRKMEEKKESRDFIYRAVLHAYMERILVSGESMEFFIEGGRSRSGKILSPKTGLLSVVVETFLRGTVKDVSIVPVSISYEKLPEVNFAGEQLGLAKKSETFWSALVQSLRSLFGFYGSVRIDFSQPFSLKEFAEVHRSRLASNNNDNNKEQLSRTYSDCFINSSEDNNDRALVHALANHITHDQSRIHSVSCTQLLSWILLHIHRKGAPMSEVVRSFESMKAEVASRGHGLGFTGLSEEVIRYALSLLGGHLVELEKDGKGVEFVRPITRLPHVIELSYYANTVNMIFSKESIIANSIYSVAYMKDVSWVKSDQMVEFLLDDVIDQSLQLFQLLKYEFPLIPVCETPEDFARSALNSLYGAGIISKPEELESEDTTGQTWRRRVHYDDDDQHVRETFGVMPRNVKQLMGLKSALGPILETYHVASSHLYKLQAGDALESEFTKEIHSHLKQRAQDGLAEYEESASLDTLKNCLRAFQDCQIVSCYDSCDVRMIGLLGDYRTPEMLNQFVGRLASFVA